jgi:hypothetical protein
VPPQTLDSLKGQNSDSYPMRPLVVVQPNECRRRRPRHREASSPSVTRYRARRQRSPTCTTTSRQSRHHKRHLCIWITAQHQQHGDTRDHRSRRPVGHRGEKRNQTGFCARWATVRRRRKDRSSCHRRSMDDLGRLMVITWDAPRHRTRPARPLTNLLVRSIRNKSLVFSGAQSAGVKPRQSPAQARGGRTLACSGVKID